MRPGVGQKVHPYGFRLGTLYGWQSNWFAERHYSGQLHEDIRVRNYIKKKLYHAGISKVVIERSGDKVVVNIHTARPGILIGKRGAEVETLRKELTRLTPKEVFINIKEIRKAELDAQLVAENVALQLERRVAFRRAMKKAMTSTMKFGAEGIRIQCSGRLGGAEMGRREWYRDGRVPLHTLRADIDYGLAEAKTTYGVIGVKCWIFKGDLSDRELRRGALAQRVGETEAR
jgi:small subunit ribosomal protein S3